MVMQDAGNKAFARILHQLREGRGVSQSRLAEESGFDHSYVSRLENGKRRPTRDAVEKIADVDVLALDSEEKDRLLIAAGYIPERTENLFIEEPELCEIWRFLKSEDVPDEAKVNLRELIAVATKFFRSTV